MNEAKYHLAESETLASCRRYVEMLRVHLDKADRILRASEVQALDADHYEDMLVAFSSSVGLSAQAKAFAAVGRMMMCGRTDAQTDIQADTPRRLEGGEKVNPVLDGSDFLEDVQCIPVADDYFLEVKRMPSEDQPWTGGSIVFRVTLVDPSNASISATNIHVQYSGVLWVFEGEDWLSDAFGLKSGHPHRIPFNKLRLIRTVLRQKLREMYIISVFTEEG